MSQASYLVAIIHVIAYLLKVESIPAAEVLREVLFASGCRSAWYPFLLYKSILLYQMSLSAFTMSLNCYRLGHNGMEKGGGRGKDNESCSNNDKSNPLNSC